MWLGYRTRSLLSVGENAESSEIIKELLCEESLDDDYRLYELLTKRQDIITGTQLQWIKIIVIWVNFGKVKRGGISIGVCRIYSGDKCYSFPLPFPFSFPSLPPFCFLFS